jgi:apolipoprotein N-acyltransferase
VKLFTKPTYDQFRKLTLCILSGMLLGAAFPPSSFGIFACIGLVPLLIVLDEVGNAKSALRYVYAAMLVFHIITLNWTGGYAHMNDPYMMIAGAVTMTVHPFFYFIPFGAFLFVRRYAGKNFALLCLPFFWVAYEYSHTLSEWSFPWLTLGNTQSYDLARIQIVSSTGVIGLSLWIVAINVLVFHLLQSVRAEGSRLWQAKHVNLLLAIVILYSLPMLYGLKVLRAAPPTERAVPSGEMARKQLVTIGMVQSNVDPWEKWHQSGLEILNMYFRLTDSLVKSNQANPPDIVLWPETAMPYYILTPQNHATLRSVKERIDGMGVPVLLGLPHAVYYDDTLKAPPSAKRINATGERYDAFNATAFIQPGVEEVPWYGKMKMVPIAERVPYADAFYIFDFLRWGVGIGGWQIGKDTVLYVEKKTGAKFCSLICYESVYPEFVASFVRKGAEFITIVTIDSWWGRMSGAYQHHQYAIFRAIENRRWIARCAVGGFSSYIDPYGRVYDKTELFTQTVLNRTILRINNRMARTFYTQHGDWLAKGCALLAVMFLVTAPVVHFIKKKK